MIRDLTLAPGQFEGLVRETMRVRLGGLYLSREDAEDAVAEAWVKLAEKADELEDGPIGGWLRGAARHRALKMLDKRRRRGDTSLEGITEQLESPDSARVLADNSTFGELDRHIAITDLQVNQVARMRLELAEQGASTHITARGSFGKAARYSDAQVARVRDLRKEGRTYRDIEDLTGVKASAAWRMVKRQYRVAPSHEGWSKGVVESALRAFYDEHGRAPSGREARRNPKLPSETAVRNLYGSWTAGVRAAGLENLVEGFTTVWDRERVLRALCAWWHREQRYPAYRELVAHNDHSIPSSATIERRLGTASGKRLIEMAREHCATVGGCHLAGGDGGAEGCAVR